MKGVTAIIMASDTIKVAHPFMGNLTGEPCQGGAGSRLCMADLAIALSVRVGLSQRPGSYETGASLSAEGDEKNRCDESKCIPIGPLQDVSH